MEEELELKNIEIRSLKTRISELEAENQRLKKCLEVPKSDSNRVTENKFVQKPKKFPLNELISQCPSFVLKILNCFDGKNLANCRLVCKMWKEFIDGNRRWWILQLRFYKYDFRCRNLYDYVLHEKMSYIERFPDFEIVFEFLEKQGSVLALEMMEYFFDMHTTMLSGGFGTYPNHHPLIYAAGKGHIGILRILIGQVSHKHLLFTNLPLGG